MIKEISELWPMLTDGATKKYVFKQHFWEMLNIETQAEIFLNRQGKSLLPAYIECIDISSVDRVVEAIIRKLENGASAKEYSAAAHYMTMFHMLASDEVLRILYSVLQKGEERQVKQLGL